MKSIRTQDAVGQILLHDLVRIVIGEVKDTPFRRGHVITEEDIPKLLDLGKEHVFVMEQEDEGFLHEEDVARALYHMAGGENMHDGPMAQGKIEATADVDGLFKVDVDRLHAINSIGELTIVTKFNNTPVKAGDKLAGMRCIPLLLEEQQVEDAKKIADGKPLLHVKPFVRKTMGIVTTGSEVLIWGIIFVISYVIAFHAVWIGFFTIPGEYGGFAFWKGLEIIFPLIWAFYFKRTYKKRLVEEMHEA